MTSSAAARGHRAARLDARKSLGQHFLLDPNLTARIARQAGRPRGAARRRGRARTRRADPRPAGQRGADVLAVELDRRAIGALHELQAVYGSGSRSCEDDATRIDLGGAGPAPRQIVANLPYNVATPLLVGWLRQAAAWERMTLMFQLEVAERICAAPGSRPTAG